MMLKSYIILGQKPTHYANYHIITIEERSGIPLQYLHMKNVQTLVYTKTLVMPRRL